MEPSLVRMNVSNTLVMLISAALIASGGLMTASWITGSMAFRNLASQLLFTPAFSWSAALTYLAAGIMLAALSRRRLAAGRGVDMLIAAMTALVLLGSIVSLSGFNISITPWGIARLPTGSLAGPLPISPAVIGLSIGIMGLLVLHRPWERSTLLLGGIGLSALGIFFLSAAGFDGKSVLLLLLGLGMLIIGTEEPVGVPPV